MVGSGRRCVDAPVSIDPGKPWGAPIVDETGLQGTFDITLRYSTKTPDAPIDAEWPSLFSALEDQLGLQLVPKQEQRPVLVVDRMERPSIEAQ